ncbi:MerR family transcriptional regulator [Clostridium sp.]|uniref:MerR family transcriptional regulator n=1 Tax=Clostridium sp. TaxID=1506 RepID=UPI002FCA3EC0
MKKQLLTIKDIAKITGITPRTLHYYDKINLLKPSRESSNGYRVYDRSDLENLQTILFFREMDLTLKEIADIMQLSKEEQREMLEMHYQTLILKQHRLGAIINSVKDYISGKELFNLNIFSNSTVLPLQEQYDREAKIVYGETEKYKEFERKIEKLSQDEKTDLYDEFGNNMDKIFKKLAVHINDSPSSSGVQALILEWKSQLEKYIVCDTEILECIADNYKSDNRFISYFNQFSDKDLSNFLYEAIMYYCKK